MAAKNELAHDERRPAIRQDLRRPRDRAVLLVFLHAASWHGRIARASSKIEPNQFDR
jgi:hypothetical protein